ncbi:hypothetical protein [Vibrio diabolicus]|uniref:hypothetical protein n=1 Tax=Vibrio diabolicus TaxID=50719 RepID=UPI00215E23E8|nr:hypothetical protein [Vibrio diabolicus]MCS0347623.1 hypothetical protein [Vibrio diabolicus]MCS0358780.1 hypothetical protein [Vibrio diabolicus]MCS0372880.1 hypothetical protein [Vibrio diabolicus]MCS0439910.1 hypothetical protein [Vibrio diabolicus]
MSTQIDIGIVYEILVSWAANNKPQSYTDLSHEYHSKTGIWFNAHGSWDQPLGTLNNMLASANAPAITALVVRQDSNEPGNSFWGCASNVPTKPKGDLARISEWTRIVGDVCTYPWPNSIPV